MSLVLTDELISVATLSIFFLTWSHKRDVWLAIEQGLFYNLFSKSVLYQVKKVLIIPLWLVYENRKLNMEYLLNNNTVVNFFLLITNFLLEGWSANQLIIAVKVMQDQIVMHVCIFIITITKTKSAQPNNIKLTQKFYNIRS